MENTMTVQEAIKAIQEAKAAEAEADREAADFKAEAIKAEEAVERIRAERKLSDDIVRKTFEAFAEAEAAEAEADREAEAEHTEEAAAILAHMTSYGKLALPKALHKKLSIAMESLHRVYIDYAAMLPNASNEALKAIREKLYTAIRNSAILFMETEKAKAYIMPEKMVDSFLLQSRGYTMIATAEYREKTKEAAEASREAKAAKAEAEKAAIIAEALIKAEATQEAIREAEAEAADREAEANRAEAEAAEAAEALKAAKEHTCKQLALPAGKKQTEKAFLFTMYLDIVRVAKTLAISMEYQRQTDRLAKDIASGNKGSESLNNKQNLCRELAKAEACKCGSINAFYAVYKLQGRYFNREERKQFEAEANERHSDYVIKIREAEAKVEDMTRKYAMAEAKAENAKADREAAEKKLALAKAHASREKADREAAEAKAAEEAKASREAEASKAEASKAEKKTGKQKTGKQTKASKAEAEAKEAAC